MLLSPLCSPSQSEHSYVKKILTTTTEVFSILLSVSFFSFFCGKNWNIFASGEILAAIKELFAASFKQNKNMKTQVYIECIISCVSSRDKLRDSGNQWLHKTFLLNIDFLKLTRTWMKLLEMHHPIEVLSRNGERFKDCEIELISTRKGLKIQF